MAFKNDKQRRAAMANMNGRSTPSTRRPAGAAPTPAPVDPALEEYAGRVMAWAEVAEPELHAKAQSGTITDEEANYLVAQYNEAYADFAHRAREDPELRDHIAEETYRRQNA